MVLNTPHIAGRVTLDRLQYGRLILPKSLPDMRKSSIAQAVSQTFGAQSEVAWLYTEISDDTQRYKTFAAEAATLEREEYDQIILATLEENLPKAIEFLRRIQEAYRTIYNGAPHSDPTPMSPYVETGLFLPVEEYRARMAEQERLSQLSF